MKDHRLNFGFGALLVLAGALLLLQNLGVFGPVVANTVWVLLFGLGGLAFLAVFAVNREYWWALIPGFVLLGLAVLISLGERGGDLGAALFLAAIGLSFWSVFAVRRDFWWAIIPGGALFSVALMLALQNIIEGDGDVGVMFLGLSVTFLLVYLISGQRERNKWALIPAIVLAIMGIAFLATMGGLINYLWPAALILGGGYLVLRTLMRRP